MTSRSESAATPRTDAAAAKYRPGWQQKWEDMVALSASLELEAANWRTQAKEWRECAADLAAGKEGAADACMALNARYSAPEPGPRVDYEYTSADVHDS
jgi:hypothetical protein